MNCLVATLFLGSLFGQQIPSEVRYKKATPELNAKFSKMLTDLLSNKVADKHRLECLNDVMVCGPGLWPIVSKVEKDDAGGKPVTFMLPIVGEPQPQVLHGRFFKSDKDRLNFLLTLQAMAKLGPFNIRKATSEEISYYWSIISYDIEEPLMVAESKKVKLLFNGAKAKIFFVDIPGHTKP